MSLGTNFLIICKDSYFKGIRPANEQSQSHENYLSIVKIAKDYLETGQLNFFKGFFQEYQYLVNLWTAHMILQYGRPDSQLKSEALEIIIRYSTSTLNSELANEEKRWLIDNNFDLPN